jgi:ankyrin repeat protein
MYSGSSAWNLRRNRRAELISVLLAYKADPNLRDVDGYTALHHAVLRNHPESVRALAQRGADLSAKTHDGFTAEDLARQNGNSAVVSLLTLLGQAGSN